MVLSERLTFHEVTPDINGEPFSSAQAEVDRSIKPQDDLAFQPAGEINLPSRFFSKGKIAPARSREEQQKVKMKKQALRGILFQG